jgi:flagellar hook assembly protein FlgD
MARLWSGTTTAGRLELRWDGQDEDGRAVANGVYLVRAELAGARIVTRLFMLH